MADGTLIEFPCRFPIKMMGRDNDAFRQSALGILREHIGEFDDDAISLSRSSKGNFLSITVTITAENQQQLDSIYQALTDHDDILVAL